MKLPLFRARPRPLQAGSAVALLVVGLCSGCGGSSAPSTGASSQLPTREQAFQLGEVHINQILIALHKPPTAQFSYNEGLCNESDDQHGHVNLDYTLPGTYSSTQATALMNTVGSAMKSLGIGTPVYDTQPDGVYVQGTSSGLLVDVDSGVLNFSYQSCYSTPAPANWWQSEGLQPLTASPALTSTAGPPAAVPTGVGSDLPTSESSASGG